MANPEHVEVVKQGAKAIEKWRKAHPQEHVDLCGAELAETNLVAANLSEAALIATVLTGSNLEKANFSRANLMMARLCGADIHSADLTFADLSGTDISETNLSSANLSFASLTFANLAKTRLNGASLAAASFLGVNFAGADFTGATCSDTVFANCDLSEALGLKAIKHEGPSSIGIDTLITSFQKSSNKLTPDLKTFFRDAGVPQELLDELPRIVAKIPYCTCFISYGEPDMAFANKLHEDLKAKGVPIFLYHVDATPGRSAWGEIGEKRRSSEKMVVLCSAESLIRPGVLKEIEEQIDENPDKLVPISLDALWRKEGFPVTKDGRDLKPFLLHQTYADFTGAMPYEQALDRLLKALERKKS